MKVTQAQWDAFNNDQSDEYLEHYGRLGMKWGQHIFGKDKESSGGKKSKSSSSTNGIRRRITQRAKEKAKAAEQKKASDAAKKAEKKAEKAEQRRESILRSPTKLYKNRNEFSQDEINSALKRFAWEKQLREYSNAELAAGKNYLDMAFNYTTSAINIYNNAARVVNSFNLSDKPWEYIEPAKKKGSGNS